MMSQLAPAPGQQRVVQRVCGGVAAAGCVMNHDHRDHENITSKVRD